MSPMKMDVTAEGALTKRLRRVNTRVTVKATLPAWILTLAVTVERREEGGQQRNTVEAS